MLYHAYTGTLRVSASRRRTGVFVVVKLQTGLSYTVRRALELQLYLEYLACSYYDSGGKIYNKLRVVWTFSHGVHYQVRTR